MFTLQLCWIIQDVLGPASHPIEDERSQKHHSHLLKKRYFPRNITWPPLFISGSSFRNIRITTNID